MPSLGTFGIPSGTSLQQSKSVKQTADAKQLTDQDGIILEATTAGSKIEKTEEFFLGASVPADDALTAVDGQNGTTVITADGYDLKAGDYGTTGKTTLVVPGAGA